MDKFKKEEPEAKKPAAGETPDTDNTEQAVDAQSSAETVEAETAPDTSADGATAEAEATDEIAGKLQEMGEKLVEMQEKYTRLYAEFENYRRRTTAEKNELILGGHRDTVKAILPVIDDMERAIAALPDGNEAKEGVKLIYDKMLSILLQKGVKPMKSIGEPFDADLHEAVTQIPAQDETQKNKVFDEVQKGYFINDKVLRHAKVVVAI